MPDLSFNLRNEYVDETMKFIKGVSSIKLNYSVIRNDTEHHFFVEGDLDGISKLVEYLSKYNGENKNAS
ncbi:MAG TPA: hypothetical protein VMC80_00600 [Patescibacteria group bacterium]|nr:hypothetical protein [Patescibacteria group bacterium]